MLNHVESELGEGAGGGDRGYRHNLQQNARGNQGCAAAAPGSPTPPSAGDANSSTIVLRGEIDKRSCLPVAISSTSPKIGRRGHSCFLGEE